MCVHLARSLPFVGLWSSQGLVKDRDIKAALGADNLGEEDELAENWDAIPML